MTLRRIFGRFNDSDPDAHTPLWFQITSRLLLLFAAALLILSLGNRLYSSDLVVGAFAAVFLAQGCAGFLYLYAWHREQKRVFATNCEFDSIYRHVLDGILILDSCGICLDANPAAFAILGAPPAEIIGHSLRKFLKEPSAFQNEWRVLLARPLVRGQNELVRRNGSKVIVNYIFTPNYLPGLNAMIFCDITRRVDAEYAARESQNLYRRMADNIDEVFWLLDASTKKLLSVNRAYETLTGRTLESIARDPHSYRDLVHPADRARVLAKLENVVHTGPFDEEFRIVRPGGEVRWVWVKGARTSDVNGQIYGTAQDITARKLAEEQVTAHLTAAEAARAEAESSSAEAEALRRATLALTETLRMDAVLDTLLETLFQIVPYSAASVLLTEENGRLFVARQAPPPLANRTVITLEVNGYPLLERILDLKKAHHLADTRQEQDWRFHKAVSGARSWIGVPLIVSDSVLGLLSISSREPRAFTDRHFRLAELLAIPAAVAIHNARLYEWAQIYALERQTLLKKLDEVPKTKDPEAERLRGRLPN